MKRLAAAAIVVCFSASGFAHSPIQRTAPENGTVVAELPAVISLDFANDIRLTRVIIIHQDHSPIQLELEEQIGFARSFTIPLHYMGEGVYRIEWRGLGVDGHAMRGDFSFTLD